MRVKTWDGNNINDGTNYDAFLTAPAYGLPRVSLSMGMRHGRWPLLGAVNRPGRMLYLDIEIKNFTATYEKQIYQWFDPEDEDPKVLVVEDDATGNNRYVEAICESLTVENRFHYVAALQIHGDVRWREVTATTDSWNITASGQTKALTNNGQDDAYPILQIMPTSAKTGGYGYKRWIPVRWNASAAYRKYPTDICNDSFDTATLVSGAKMQADGDDLRVIVDGIDTDRWLDGINTSTTKVWVNLDFQAKQEATLKTSIAASGSITEIEVVESIEGFPSSGILMIQSEAFSYTDKDNSLRWFTGITRAVKGTSMGAHTVAGTSPTVWWVQHDIWILYGSASATTPATDDSYKPIFDLSTSTNTSWDYNEFREDDGLRTGSWGKLAMYGGPDYYGGNRGVTADPWVELGIYCEVGEYGGLYIYNPCEITNANFQNGEKYATVTSKFDGAIFSGTGAATTLVQTIEYDIPDPSASSTWESWSQNEALDSGATFAGIRLDSKVSAISIGDFYLEVSDVTLTLNSNYTPTITIGSEQSNYSLECTITNNTTGEAIVLSFAMDLDEELEVDTDAKTVVYLLDDGSQFQALTLTGGPRRDWLPLQPGSNTLQFDDTGTNAVTISFEWEERHYL